MRSRGRPVASAGTSRVPGRGRCARRPSAAGRTAGAPLGEARVQLAERFLGLLAEPSTDPLPAARDLVLQARELLVGSAEYAQLRQRFVTAAAEYGRGQAAAAAGSPANPFSVPGISARPPGSNPFGMPAAVVAAGSAALGARTGAPAGPGRVPAEPWPWQDVRTLAAFGLGSLGQYRAQLASGQRSAQEGGRAGMRLLQLALLLALRDDLLPGPGARAVAFDPAYDEFDRRLLTALGVEVAAEDVGCRHVAAEDAPSLVYMPTCERQLYDALLDANWSQQRLPRLALVGTSLRSLADSSLLFEALTGGTSGGGGGAPQTGGPGPQGHAAELCRRGAVLEVGLPDCGCHGIATALHLFPPGPALGFLPMA